MKTGRTGRLARAQATLGVGALLALLTVSLPAVGQSDFSDRFEADPLGLIANYEITSYYTNRLDSVEVWICEIGWGPPKANLTINELVAVVDGSGLKEFMHSVSGGRYEMRFVPGHTTEAGGVFGCRGDDRSPRTNSAAILAIPDGETGLGWGPRSINFSTTYPRNRRSAVAGFYDGLRDMNVAGTAIVFGNTLGWPISKTGITDRMSDNPMDLMGDGNRGKLHVGTLAVNRYAAGWIAPGDVHMYDGGGDLVTLSVDWESGVQMIVLPTGTQGDFLSLGARVAKQHDRGILKEGVEAYVVEHSYPKCRVEVFGPCWGKARRQTPQPHDTEIATDVLGAPIPKNPVMHVLGVGQHTTWNNVTVTVTERIGDKWVVDIREGAEPAPRTNAAYQGTDRFTDDNGNAHEANINRIAEQGVTVGCSTEPARYCPDRPVTRAQMAAFMLRAVGEPDPTPSRRHILQDVPDDAWYTKFVHALADRGVDRGENGQWRPTDPLTRLEMAHWITAMFESIPPSANSRGLFEDVPFDNRSDLAAIEGLFRSGVTYGCSADPLRYCPEAAVTRGQMASFLVRALNRG